jgi:hypothetical protein
MEKAPKKVSLAGLGLISAGAVLGLALATPAPAPSDTSRPAPKPPVVQQDER